MEPLSDLTARLESARRTRPLIRAIIALGRSQGDAAATARRTWPGDAETVKVIEKGAVTPLTTTTSGAPVATRVSDLINILGPSSASGALIARAMQLSFDDYATLSIPGVTASATGVAFIAEGAPFPIKQLVTSAASVKPRKIAMGLVATKELINGSNAEALMRAVLAENLTLGLDALMFDATDTDGIRPAGLRFGVNAIAATSGGGNEALIADLANIAAALAPVAGQQIAYVASPKQSAKIILRRTMNLPFPVLSSAALADGIVMGVALNALVIAGDAAPRIDTSTETIVHMEQSSPLPITTGGATPSFAAPVRSLFQTDAVGIRLIMELDWTLRATSGAVAWTQSVTW